MKTRGEILMIDIKFTEFDYSPDTKKNGITLFIDDRTAIKLKDLVELDNMIEQLVQIRHAIKNEVQ
jgi:hypothetical protein